MRLQQLTIHNLASIEDATIDFREPPLATSEVFLITGKTGAGKSTLLDAICLALYANTPRMINTQMQGEVQEQTERLKLNDPRQLMRRNTTEAYTVLQFIGNDEQRYEATWGVRRANKKLTGALQRPVWVLRNLQTEQVWNKEKDIKAEINRIIGLDFKQFCRTTMLAQGEFTRFLNSNDNDKAEILEKITGTTIYSKIGQKVYELTQQAEREYERLQQQIQTTPLLTPEDIAQKGEEIQGLAAQHQQLIAQRKQAEQQLQWLTQEQQITQQLAAARQRLQTLLQQTQTQQFQSDNQLIRQWNETIDAQQQCRQLDEAQRQLQQVASQVERLQQKYAELLMGESLILTTLQQYDQQIDQLQTNLPPELAHLTDIEALRQQKEQQLIRISQIQLAQTLYQQYVEALKRHSQAQKDLRTLADTIQQNQRVFKELQQQYVTLKQQAEQRKTEYETQKLTVAEWAKTMRTRLTVGATCPVCLQTVQTAIPHEDELTTLYQVAEQTYKKAQDAFQQTERQYNQLQAQLQTDSKQYDLQKRTLDNDQTLPLALEKVSHACQQIHIELNDETSQYLTDAATATQHIEKNLEAIIRYSESKQRGETLLQNLQRIRQDILLLQAQWKQTEPLGKPVLKDIDQTAQQLYTTLRIAIENQNNATRKQTQAAEALQVFTQQHTEYTLPIIRQLSQVSSTTISFKTDQQKRLTDRLQQVAAQIAQVEQQQTEHNTKKPQEQAEANTADLAAQIKLIDEQATALSKQQGALQQQLQDDQNRRKQIESLTAQATAAQQTYLQWAKLNALIGDATGNKFRRIAQSYVLQNLIHNANYYLQSLTDRYLLRVEPNSFVLIIEDAYQGYTRRAASTISGGESFLVSLALALALSDIGSQLSVDTLFIDEGFGTLSGEPMQKAIQTLYELHNKTGRHVGIISHIDELKERVAVQIQVLQEGNSSSSKIQVVG